MLWFNVHMIEFYVHINLGNINDRKIAEINRRVYIQNYLGQKDVSLLLNEILNKVGRPDLFTKKYIWDN